jgi:hypothetical protein
MKQLSDLVDSLLLPPAYGIAEVIAAVQRFRGRPIVCLAAHELDATAEVCGLVISSPAANADVIFYASSLTPWLRQHTIGHELGHLLAGHTSAFHQLPASVSDLVLPLLRRRYHAPLVEAMFGDSKIALRGRLRFDDREEQEADLIATLLLNSRYEQDAALGNVAAVLQPIRPRARRKS